MVNVFSLSKKRVSSLLGGLLLALAGQSYGNELTGYLAVESRSFFSDALYTDQSDYGASASAEVEYYHDWDDYRQRFVATAYARWDPEDSERSHGDIRELYWWREFEEFEVYAGVRKVFWGVTETVHLVDVINQDDAVENLDGEDKLGQPMISVLMERDWGTLEAFALLGFRERAFAGDNGRLRGPLVVDDDKALYQSGAGDKHIDLALRWSQVFGDWDLGVSHFMGTARDPQLLLDAGAAASEQSQPLGLRPYYAQIQQTGLDVQATLGDWLWKLEAISVKQKGEDRQSAAVGGFEYTFVGISDSAADLGVLLEYQFDDRRGLTETTAQNDIALGARWVLNDIQSTEVLAALSVDLDNGSRFASVEASRRLGDKWLLEAELRLFSNTADDDPAYTLRDDDYLQLELRRYF